MSANFCEVAFAATDHLEVWTLQGRDLVSLATGRLVIGGAEECDLVLDDPTISNAHAVLELVSSVWVVRDLGSRNGTFVNSQRIGSDKVLRSGDELRLGQTRLVLRGPSRGTRLTSALVDPPRVTDRERDVLIELCRPLAAGGAFTEPASVREIATTLVVSQAAVKQHLANLFTKFDVSEGDHRRARLANAALTAGLVTLGDLSRSD